MFIDQCTPQCHTEAYGRSEYYIPDLLGRDGFTQQGPLARLRQRPENRMRY
jgi:hypothetical protein